MDLSDFYVEFEDSFRGDRAVVRKRLLQYEPLLTALQRQDETISCVDLGCGRGEWLDILRQRGLDAVGIDLDPRMVQLCKDQELNVELSDATSYLSSLVTSSVSLISGFHIAEHLQFEDLYQLVTEAFRVLKPRGVLLLETPNAENIIVASLTFHLDPTHQKPIPPQLLQFLMTHIGFEQTEILRINQDETALTEEIPSVTGLLFGPSPDFSILGLKGDTDTSFADIKSSVEHLSGITTHSLATRYDLAILADRDKLDKRLAEIAKSVSYAMETAAVAREAAVSANEAAISCRDLAIRIEEVSAAAERELKAMRDSWSWRITAPLRKICRALIVFLEAAKTLATFRLTQLNDANQLDCEADTKVYVDVTLIAETDLRTGIQRVVRGIIDGLFALAPNNVDIIPVRLVSLYGSWQFEYADQFVRTHYPKRTPMPNVRLQPATGDSVLLLDFSALATVEAYESGFLTAMKNKGVNIFPVIYDLLPISHPELFPPHASSVHQSWASMLPAVSEKLLCISKTTRDTYNEFKGEKGLPDIDIGVFRLGSNIEGSLPSIATDTETEELAAKTNLRFLMVGTIEPRKGHAVVLKAFKALWEEGCGYELVIVGKPGWQTDDLIETIRETTYGGRLQFLENISDDELVECYSSADCLIAASIAEGYGLPLLEAAHYGIPIIARDIAPFREIAGHNAYYFEDDSTGALTQTIEAWALLHAEDAHPRSEDVEIPTWLESASDILALMNLDGSLVERAT